MGCWASKKGQKTHKRTKLVNEIATQTEELCFTGTHASENDLPVQKWECPPQQEKMVETAEMPVIATPVLVTPVYLKTFASSPSQAEIVEVTQMLATENHVPVEESDLGQGEMVETTEMLLTGEDACVAKCDSSLPKGEMVEAAEMPVTKTQLPVGKCDSSPRHGEVIEVAEMPVTENRLPVGKCEASLAQADIVIEIAETLVTENDLPVELRQGEFGSSLVTENDLPVEESPLRQGEMVETTEMLVTGNDTCVGKCDSSLPQGETVEAAEMPITETHVPAGKYERFLGNEEVIEVADVPVTEIDLPVKKCDVSLGQGEVSEVAENDMNQEQLESIQVEFVGVGGNADVSSFAATIDTTIGALRKHVVKEVTGGKIGFQIMLINEAAILGNDECKLAELKLPCDTGIIELSYVVQEVNADPTDAEVAADPSSFDLHLAGHARAQCNGLYTYAGRENGKHKWHKPGGNPKVFWTYWGGRGHTWDIFWGGISPENKSDTAIPPRSGWDGQGQTANTIRISYKLRG